LLRTILHQNGILTDILSDAGVHVMEQLEAQLQGL